MRISIFIACVALIGATTVAQTIVRHEYAGELANLRLQEIATAGRSKSATLAVVLSLILPGMGEWYAGNFDSGKYFLIADGSFWLTYGAFRLRGDWLREDARSFATLHAGAQFSGKDDQFAVNVGGYSSVDDYNQARLRERRFGQIYSAPDYAWLWDTDVNRMQFRDTRVKSDQMYENAKFAIGALVVNRLISAFSAGRAAARSNAAQSEAGAWRMGAVVRGGLEDAHGIELRIAREF
ncbi:MAG: hypothetical protein ACRDGA_08380 [Bacteroidota bacterium]